MDMVYLMLGSAFCAIFGDHSKNQSLITGFSVMKK